MKFDVNVAFGGSTKVDITSQSQEEKIRRVFCYGNCHSLALALHKLTGWQLFGVFRPGDFRDNVPSHVIVQDPDGFCVDIDGIRTVPEFLSEWGAQLMPVNPWHIRVWIRRRNQTGCGYRPTRVKDSMPFAQMVLETYNNTRPNPVPVPKS